MHRKLVTIKSFALVHISVFNRKNKRRFSCSYVYNLLENETDVIAAGIGFFLTARAFKFVYVSEITSIYNVSSILYMSFCEIK